MRRPPLKLRTCAVLNNLQPVFTSFNGCNFRVLLSIIFILFGMFNLFIAPYGAPGCISLTFTIPSYTIRVFNAQLHRASLAASYSTPVGCLSIRSLALLSVLTAVVNRLHLLGSARLSAWSRIIYES